MKKQQENNKQEASSETQPAHDECFKQIEEWKAKYLRALADYHNLEKRTSASVSEANIRASGRVIVELLPIVDTLENAHKHLGDQGLELALNQIIQILKRFGVEKMHTVGTLFDPVSMEAVDVKEGEENMVLSEMMPGYLIYGSVLRIAKVVVGKKITGEIS